MSYPLKDPDIWERDRRNRQAMRYFSEDLYRKLKAQHPAIVKHLQSLPNAQRVVIDVHD